MRSCSFEFLVCSPGTRFRRLKPSEKSHRSYAHHPRGFLNSFRGSNLIASLGLLGVVLSACRCVVFPSVYTKISWHRMASPRRFIRSVTGWMLRRMRRIPRVEAAFRAQWGLSDDDVAVFCVGHVFLRKGVMDFCRRLPRFLIRIFWVGKNYPHLTMGQRKMNCLLKNPPRMFIISDT